MSSKVTISKSVIDALKPGQQVSDLGITGFTVRRRSGGSVVAELRYAVGRTRRRFKLGEIGEGFTVHQARQLARERFADVTRGDDPAAAKRAQRTAMRVSELVEGYRVDRIPGMKATTQVSEAHLITLHLLPRLGTRTLESITRRDVERIKLDMKATPGAANKVIGLVSRLFGYAAEIGAVAAGTNPAHGVKRNPGKTIERWMTADERARLERALTNAEHTPVQTRGHVDGPACACFRLLALTGMRLGEVIDLRWCDVDLDHRRLTLPTSKTGAKIVRLPSAAIDLLAALPRDHELVFTTPDGAKLSNMQRRWIIIRNAADLRDLRIHDLRHSWASDAVMHGVPLAMVGRQLGHAKPTTTQRYAHLADDVMGAAVERVGEIIAANTANGDASPKVVKLAAARP